MIDERTKIEEHLINLEVAQEFGDLHQMQTALARLSRYYSSLTEEEVNKFLEFELMVETGNLNIDENEDYYEDPSWEQEWYDFDPDC